MDSDDIIIKKEKFMRLWKFFAWLDKARWSEPDSDFKERTIRLFNKMWNDYGIPLRGESLEPEDIVLAHWLTYIFSYVMHDELVWPKAFPVMGYIAYKFRKDNMPAEQIKHEHIRPLQDEHTRPQKENYEFYVKGSAEKPLVLLIAVERYII